MQIGKFFYPYIGGAELHLFTLVSELKKRSDFEITILVSNTSARTEIETNNGVKIIRLATIGCILSMPICFSMPFWLRKQKADILHFHLPNPLSVISYFLSRPRGKIVVSYHNDIVRQKILAYLIDPLLIRFLKKSEAIIVTSDNIIQNSFILKKVKDKCKIIPYGIDIDRFEPNEKILKKAGEIKHNLGSPLVLFVGRLVYYKGLSYLVKAMKDVKAKLLIVGDGPLRNKIKRLARRLFIDDRIFWVGEVKNEDIARYYYACDIFVLPSVFKAEGFGLVQLEAFACSRPVVSTNLPTGVPFVNINNKTGIIVAPRNTVALTCAINRLLDSPELRKNYGENGRERVERGFIKELMAEKTSKIYDVIGINNRPNQGP